MQVGKTMSAEGLKAVKQDFISIPRGEIQYAADRLMRLARVRHLPVVQEGRLVGVLSHRDLLESALAERDAHIPPDQLQTLRSQPIAPLVRTDVVAVEPDCPPGRAAELMLRFRIGFLPVVERGPEGPRLVGIITESELLRAAYGPDFSADS